MRGEEPSYAPGRIIAELMLMERAELVVAEISIGFVIHLCSKWRNHEEGNE